MKILKKLAIILIMPVFGSISAQPDNIIPINTNPAERVLNKYFAEIGGKSALENIQAIKTVASVNVNGTEIPLEYYQTVDGKQLVKLKLYGIEMTQLGFDGTTLWTTNLATMQPEISDAEATENIKTKVKDFPSPFLNYKEKGFSVTFMGKEEMNGVEAYKIKLVQPSLMINGAEVPSISYHYFDANTYLLLASQHQVQEGDSNEDASLSIMENYREVNGIYFPFTQTVGGQKVEIIEIIVNPPINDSMFKFPK